MSCFEVGNSKNNRSLIFTEGDFYKWLLYFYFQPHLCAYNFLEKRTVPIRSHDCNTGAQRKQMLLPYAITRSTRRQNEMKVSQFREHQDITFHSSALHLHTATRTPSSVFTPPPEQTPDRLWAHQENRIQHVLI